jgi:hypothetical protein
MMHILQVAKVPKIISAKAGKVKLKAMHRMGFADLPDLKLLIRLLLSALIYLMNAVLPSPVCCKFSIPFYPETGILFHPITSAVV